jgi:hypothetical protein
MPQAWFKLHPQVSKYSTSLKLGTELSSTNMLVVWQQPFLKTK